MCESFSFIIHSGKVTFIKTLDTETTSPGVTLTYFLNKHGLLVFKHTASTSSDLNTRVVLSCTFSWWLMLDNAQHRPHAHNVTQTLAPPFSQNNRGRPLLIHADIDYTQRAPKPMYLSLQKRVLHCYQCFTITATPCITYSL
jgi:hypothetical protein